MTSPSGIRLQDSINNLKIGSLISSIENVEFNPLITRSKPTIDISDIDFTD